MFLVHVNFEVVGLTMLQDSAPLSKLPKLCRHCMTEPAIQRAASATSHNRYSLKNQDHYSQSTMRETDETSIGKMEFHCFSKLPKEIRQEIWRFALPEPRFIELTARNQERPHRIYRRAGKATEVLWTALSPPLLLLNVNHEARQTTLESYEPSAAWDQSATPWRRAYVNYSKDVLYFTADSLQALLHFLNGDAAPQMLVPLNLAKVSTLSVEARFGHRYCENRRTLQPSDDCRGRSRAIRNLGALFATFPKLKRLLFVIDGRDSGFGGPDHLVKATEEHEDYSLPNGREAMMHWTSQLIEEVGSRNPGLLVPAVGLSLLVNGSGHSEAHLERRWDYSRAECEVHSPSFPDLDGLFFKGTDSCSSSPEP